MNVQPFPNLPGAERWFAPVFQHRSEFIESEIVERRLGLRHSLIAIGERGLRGLRKSRRIIRANPRSTDFLSQ